MVAKRRGHMVHLSGPGLTAALAMLAGKPAKQLTPKEQHEQYIARAKLAGKRILTYKAPCGHELETPAPEGGKDRWTTAATCPECGALYMKATTHNSVVVTEMPA
jgi:hypothetical protein